MTKDDFDEWVPNRAVASIFHVSTRTLFAWSGDPKLNFPKPSIVNGRKYYSRAEIEAWRATRRFETPAPLPESRRGILPQIPKQQRRARRKAGRLIDLHAETVEG